MYSQFKFVGNNSDVIEFDIGDTPAGSGYPIKELVFEYNNRVTRRPKMERVGAWPGFMYPAECLIHTTFDILSDDATDLNTKKIALSHAVYPDPTAPQTIETLGELTITMLGLGEDIVVPVGIDGDISIPTQFPNYGLDCQITWTNADGVFYGATSGDYYYLK